MAEIDLNREIRRAVDTGKAVFGQRQSEKVLLGGKAELVIVGKNTPQNIKEKFANLSKVSEIPLYDFDGTGISLGSICGKPFVVSVMVIEKAGKSKILEAAGKK